MREYRTLSPVNPTITKVWFVLTIIFLAISVISLFLIEDIIEFIAFLINIAYLALSFYIGYKFIKS